MYSRKQSGGSVDPYIYGAWTAYEAEVLTPSQTELANIFRIARGRVCHPRVIQELSPGRVQRRWRGMCRRDCARTHWQLHVLCQDREIDMGLCGPLDHNRFLFDRLLNYTLYFNGVYNLDTRDPVKVDITQTGYYCIEALSIDPSNRYFSADVEFRNAYGQLTAADYPKLAFYAGVSLYYAVVFMFWMFLFYRFRSDVLPVQKYLSILLPFLVFENIVQWTYFDIVNQQGFGLGSRVLMVVTTILSAFRNSLSLFLLLIVCMGFSVVKQSLGKHMLKCRVLALVHFCFGAVYAIGASILNPEESPLFFVFIIVPLSITFSIFYAWTLTSLSQTIRDLLKRQQTVKALMYRRLQLLLIVSVILIFGFAVINSLVYSPVELGVPWQWRWFLMDGYLNLIYMIVVTTILFLWRPTADNRRFAMSEQLAQSEEFEFDDTNIDTMSDDGDGAAKSTVSDPARPAGTGSNGYAPPAYQSSGNASASAHHDDSREELFAVADEESDDDEQSSAREHKH